MIISSSITIFVVFITIIIILLCASIYFYFYNRFMPAASQEKNVASLEQRKSLLLAEIDECQKRLTDNKDELLKVEAERVQQEKYRKELEQRIYELASKQEEMTHLQNQYNNCQNELLVATRERNALLTDREQIKDDIVTFADQREQFKQEARETEAESEKLKIEVEQLLEEKNTLKDSIKELSLKIEADEQRLLLTEKEYNNVQNELSELKEKKAGIESLLHQALDKQKQAEELAEDAAAKNKMLILQLDDTNTELKEKQAALNTLNLSIAEKNISLNAFEHTLIEKQRNLELLNNEKEELLKNITLIKDTIIEFKSEIDELEKEKIKSATDAQKMRDNLEQLVVKEADLKSKSATLENSIKEAEEYFSRIKENSLQIETYIAQLTKKEDSIKESIQIEKQNKNKAEELVEETKNTLIEQKNTLNNVNLNLAEKNILLTTLEARISRIQEEEKQLKSKQINDSKSLEYNPYETLYQKPAFFSDLSTSYDSQYSEEKALSNLKEYLSKCKLDFHERVINSFHTSLKIVDISPLLVMAGISGTGKSELPRRYAEAMGMHCLILPVQPRWDSPQDMFGFYNYLEQQYKPTELSQSLVFMDRWNHKERAKFHDRLLIVLLDEMNLARPEYYFSEFLSRLETRRSINPDIDDKRRDAEISLDIGKYGEGIKTPHLYVHNNVMFIGTMNEDESTQTLSDKVIDRANIIRFNRPKKMSADIPKESENNSNKYLPLSVWNRWRANSYKDLKPEIYNKVESWISKINNSLADIGRPFGHRINQTIFAYLANYPQVNYDNTYKYAFADQLEQKILPKLRGLDIEANGDCFVSIQNIIKELNDEELFEAYERATKKDKYMFTWHGVSRENKK